MAPAGDSLTRKSVFDSYTLGCIPVIFAKATLSQYFWHLSEKEIEESTVYIPKLDVIDEKINFMTVLEQLPPDVVMQKQAAVARLAPKLQYTVVPQAFVPEKGAGNDPNKRLYWKPPFKDATDIIIDRILDADTIEPIGGLTDEKIKEMQKQQYHIMGTNPDYMGMSSGYVDPTAKRKPKPKANPKANIGPKVRV